MVYALAEGDRNCLLASRIYRQKFYENRQPSAKAFGRLKNRFEDTGNVFYKKKIFENKVVSNEENERIINITRKPVFELSSNGSSARHKQKFS
jgi:hypothetical protein